MATFIVTTNIDESYDNGDLTAETGDGNGLSLREAIGLANANPGADNILFDASVFTGSASSLIRLTLGTELEITDAVTIDGSGAVDVTISGDDKVRVFNITNTNAATTLKELTVTGGQSTEDGALGDNTHAGGGIRSVADLTIVDSTIADNATTGDNAAGGGVHVGPAGVLTVTGSTISGNWTEGVNSFGGGLHATEMVVINSTISGNHNQKSLGGGLFATEMVVINSTISGNHSQNLGSGIFVTNNSASLTLTNSIVLGNNSQLEVPDALGDLVVFATGATIDFQGLNIIGPGNDTDDSDNIINAALDDVFADVVKIDPDGTPDSGDEFETGALADNGGLVRTIALLRDSANPALDSGDNDLADDADGNPLTTDARGESRIDNSVVDVGAFEIQNTAPTVSGLPGSLALLEDTSSNVDLSTAVFGDTDGDNITVTLALDSGAFSTPGDGGTTVTETLVNDQTITLVGAAADINTYLDTVTNIQYTGAANVNGDAAATITVTVADFAQSASAETVNINITAVNDAPSFTAGPDQSIDEDAGEQTVVGWATGLSTGPANESTQNLSFDVINDNNALFAAQPTVAADGTLTYTPAANAFGTATVTVVAKDDGGTANGGVDTSTEQTFVIAISGVADDPVAVDDTAVTDEDTPVTIDVLTNDSDPDNDDLTVTQASAQNGTAVIEADGTLTYTPDADFNGTDTISYTVSDGNSGTDTATVTVTVTPVNDAPVAADDAFSTDEDTPVSGNVLVDNGSGADSDIDVDALTVSLLQDVSGGTLTLGNDGAFTYIPGVDVNGVDMFAYQVSDGTLTDTATVTIDVNPINDPPVARDDALATDEDTAISGDLTADNGNGPDSDPDSDTLSVYLVNGQLGAVDSTTTLPSGALLTVFADGRYLYHPNGAFDHLALGETAIDSFTYAIFDGNGGVDSATATVTIDGVNDAPDAVDDDFATGKDSGVFGNVLADNGNGADSDPDGGTSLIVTHVNGSAAAVGSQILLPSGALLMLNADGSFLYGTNGAFEALGDDESFADSFTYTIGDGDGGSDGATATVTIDGGNEAPVAADDALATDEDTAITGNVFSDNGNGPDSDANGDTLTVSAVNGAAAAVGNEIMLPSGARLTLNSNGSFVYDPMGAFDDLSPGEADTDGFTYTITDGKGGSATATVSIGIDGLVDVIQGTPDEDNLSGTDGDDQIYALASDDIIDPRGGSHMIDGGGGSDTVVYATTRSVFDVDLIEASGFTVAGESAALVGGHIVVERPDGETDTLIDVERIDFTDGDLIYDIDSPNVEVVYRMYAAALGRTPDETGLRYWVDRLDFLDDLPGSTADSLLQVLADVFIEADEFEMLYGSDPSNADYIDAMYQNVLGRLPDDEGRAFWIDAMERGLERDDILIAFSESAENRDQTAPDLDDGIWVI